MNKKYLTLVLLFLVNFAIAQVKYTSGKSTATFQIRNMGFNTSGNIDGIKADILFDATNPANTTITAVANVNSLKTGNDAKDEHLKSADYFDVATYPKITMKSLAINYKSGNSYIGKFNVTIKNKTLPLDVPFTYTETGNTGEFNGILKLKRTDFGIGGSSMVMSNDVTVTIDVVASK